MQKETSANYEYVSVYLLDSPYAIDTSYDYFVPIDLRGQIKRGSFITVPFGRTNRKQMGIVWEMLSSSAYKNPKSVSGVCADRNPLSEEMLGLCMYMKNQLLCTMGDAVRCAVPAAALGRLAQYYSPAKGSSPNASAGFTTADLFVYEYIVSKGLVGMDTLKGKFGAAAANESVERLFSKGMLERSFESGKVMGEQYESYYFMADEDVISRVKIASEKQRLIMEILACGRDMTAREILAASGTSDAPLKALVEKGAVIKKQERIYRDGQVGELPPPVEYKLNAEQSAALEKISAHICSREPRACLLFGVTGSGKTSVIVSSIDRAIAEGRGVIVLLPEIALTPQTLNIFRSRYGERVALVHSGLSAGERYDAYTRIISGEADIVVGTRSAIFSPVKNLGLIVIDEEHEATYKSETNPKYHARDIARFRCAKNNALMLLASATPSFESFYKAEEGKYTLIKMTHRYGKAKLPKVTVVDMRKSGSGGMSSPLGNTLCEKLLERIHKGEQSILFLNRRGYNNFISCQSCGNAISCPTCSVSMTYHTYGKAYNTGELRCHWCGKKIPLPMVCPECGSEHLTKMGYGTQRVEQELTSLLPLSRIIRMDTDTTSTKSAYEKLLGQFRSREADVLLGTQMVTKGHDFPAVTLVGVLSADASLYLDDYRAAEKTFAMLTQVIGRAGRADREGEAIIQTSNPDHECIRLACQQNYEDFYRAEIRLRKELCFPPFCDIAVIALSSSLELALQKAAQQLSSYLIELSKSEFSDIPLVIFGPFEAPVYKVDSKYRIRTVIKCRLNKRSRELFSRIIKNFSTLNAKNVNISVDFNPSTL